MTSYINYSRLGRVWYVTSWLGTGISKSFFLRCKIAIVLLFLQNNVDGFRLACWSFWYWMGGIGGRVRLSSSGRSGSSSNFSEQIKGTISREEHKTIYCDLRITGMALSNQRELPAFFSPWLFNLKSDTAFFPTQQFPVDDLSRLAKIPAYDKPESHVPGRWL